MSIETLFESLDKEVFTPEMKDSIKELFESAVQERAQTKALSIADDLVEAKLVELEEKAEAYAEYVKNETLGESDLTDKISQYLDLVVQEFVSEARESLDESVKSVKADMLIEAFDSMLHAAGSTFADLVESSKAEDSEDRVNRLAQEVIELKEENEKLTKMGIINELSEGLTLVQTQKFQRLAEMVQFNRSSDYTRKLAELKEDVLGTKAVDELKESTHTKAVWAHLI